MPSLQVSQCAICAGRGSFIFGFFQASITLEPKDQKLIGQVNQLEPSENERYIEPKKKCENWSELQTKNLSLVSCNTCLFVNFGTGTSKYIVGPPSYNLAEETSSN